MSESHSVRPMLIRRSRLTHFAIITLNEAALCAVAIYDKGKRPLFVG
jgi:hypothetical protein